jgi:cytosine/adenosine deaminase-related metal-dependent hydrolase
MIHLAEGTDAEAQNELERLVAADALHSNTILIHGVGLTPSQSAAAISRGAGLVWCPSSNFFLLNASASVGDFSNARALAVGSDSRLTGERDLLDELHFAKDSNQISSDALLRAVTSDAAAMLRLRDVGRLAPGKRADLLILPRRYRSAADALGTISRAELRAVIRDGTLRIADPDFALVCPDATRALLDDRTKLISRDLANQYRQSSIQETGFELQ